MKVELTAAGGKWETVEFGEQSFEVFVTPPGFDQKMIDWEIAATFGRVGSRTAYRLETAITNWRGLNVTTGDKGKAKEIPLEFTKENLRAICGRYPLIADSLSLLAHRAFEGLSDTDLGNSQPPSGETSTPESKDGPSTKTTEPDTTTATTPS